MEKINFAGSWLKPFPNPSFTHRTSQGPRKKPGRNRHGHGSHGGKLLYNCWLFTRLAGVLQMPMCTSRHAVDVDISNIFLIFACVCVCVCVCVCILTVCMHPTSTLSSRLATCDYMKLALAKVLSTFFARVSKFSNHD